ncbi:chitobiase/beta-hexosaminidase C-terminal domain-containing protein, partial [Deltaproteobacteria bacterium TL4]
MRGKAIVLMGMMMTIAGWAYGQGLTLPSGAKLDLNGAAAVEGAITTAKGATFEVSSGTVTVTGDWNQAGTFTSGNGTVILQGTSAQNLGKSDGTELSFSHLTVNNVSGVVLQQSASVNGTLNLTAGKVTLGNNNLTLSNTTSINNASASNYVVTDGTGTLTRNGISNANTVFPVGPTATAYNPLTINNAGTSDNFSVRVGSSVFNPPVKADKLINLEWLVSENTTGGSNAALTFQWNQADEGSSFFRSNALFAGIWNGSGYTNLTPSSRAVLGSGPYQMTVSELSSFNRFIIWSNNAPTISDGGSLATHITYSEAYNFVPTKNDGDGDNLSFSITNKPIWASFNTATGALTGTPSKNDLGMNTGVRICVNDGNETTCLPSFDLSVQSCISTQNGSMLSSSSFGNHAICGKADSEVVIASGHVVTWDGTGGPITGKITIQQGGTLRITGSGGEITNQVVLAGGTLDVDQSVTITTSILLLASSTIDAEAPLYYTGAALLIGGNMNLSFKGSGAINATYPIRLATPTSVLSLNGTGTVSKVTVNEDAAGSRIEVNENVTLAQLTLEGNATLDIASDKILTLQEDFIIENSITFTLAGTGTLDLNGTLTLNGILNGGNATLDIRGESLILGSNLEMTGFTLLTDKNTHLTLTENVSISYDHPLTFGSLTTNEHTLNLGSTHLTPLAQGSGSTEVDEGEQGTLDGTASSDLDGTIASYHWEQTAGSSATIADATSAQTTFTAPSIETNQEELRFQLTVTDNQGLNDTATLTVQVNNTLPVAVIKSITPSAPHQGQVVEFQGSGPKAETIIDYSWRLIKIENNTDGSPAEIGTTANVTINYLYSGTYRVEFRVQNADKEWSLYTSQKLTVEDTSEFSDLEVSRDGIFFTNEVGSIVLNPQRGDTVFVNVEVRNAGVLDTPSAVTLGLYEGEINWNNFLGNQTVAMIRKESSQTLQIPWKVGYDKNSAPISGYTDGTKILNLKAEYTANVGLSAPYPVPEVSFENNQVTAVIVVGNAPDGNYGIDVNASVSASKLYSGYRVSLAGDAHYQWANQMKVMGAEVTIELDKKVYSARTISPAGQFSTSVYLPVALGAHTAVVRVFDGNLQGETVLTLNVIALPDPEVSDVPPPLPQTDLTVSAIHFNGDKVYSIGGGLYSVKGQAIQLGITVQNVGTQTTDGPFEVILYDGSPDNGSELCRKTVSENLATQASRKVDCDHAWTPSAAQNHVIYAVVDTAKVIEESNEYNNRVSKSIGIREALPDLRPYQMTHIQNSGLRFSKEPVLGEHVTVFVDVYNVGQSDLNSEAGFGVIFYDGDPNASGKEIGRTTMTGPLAANDKMTASIDWDTSKNQVTAGSHAIYAVVDSSNTIAEDLEDNNRSQKALTIFPVKAELYPVEIQFSNNTPQISSKITLSSTIQNNGGRDSENETVRFYLGDPDVNGVLIAEVASGSVAAQRGQSTVSVTWTTPDTPNTVSLYVRVQENVTNRSLKIYGLAEPPPPDLRIVSRNIGFIPESPEVGATVSVWADVENLSSVSTAKNFQVKFYLETPTAQSLLGPSVSVVTLAPSSTVRVQANASFVADAPYYAFKVEVLSSSSQKDGYLENNTATTSLEVGVPIAEAGADQTIEFGTAVTLNGSGSFVTGGRSITYQWQRILAPEGSTVSLSASTVVAPVFKPDQTGEYRFQLTVTDGVLYSSADEILIAVTDTLPPTTTVSPKGKIFNSNQSITLSCGDGSGTGCKAIHYTTNNSDPTEDSPVYLNALNMGQNTTLKYFAIDQAGNKESISTQNYTIDLEKPVTIAAPGGATYTSPQSVTLSCKDGSGTGCASIYYTTDGSTPTVSSTRYTKALLFTSNTVFKFFAVDTAENPEVFHTENYVIHCQSQQNGNLLNAGALVFGNSDCGQSDDTVIIAKGHTITWDGTNAPFSGNVTIQEGGTLKLLIKSPSFKGTVTTLPGGILEIDGESQKTFFAAGENGKVDPARSILDLRGGTLVLKGHLDLSGGTVLTDASTTLMLTGDSKITSDQALTLGTLALNNKILVLGSASSDLTIAQPVTLNDVNERIITGEANLTFNGLVTMTGGLITSTGKNVIFNGGSALSGGVLITTGGTVQFSNTNTHTINGNAVVALYNSTLQSTVSGKVATLAIENTTNISMTNGQVADIQMSGGNLSTLDTASSGTISNVILNSSGFAIGTPVGNIQENGSWATFPLHLTSRPLGQVVVSLSSSDETEGTVSPKQLTFTPDNWNAPQIVTVTGLDDDMDDGDQAFSIHPVLASTEDPTFKNEDLHDVPLTNVDDETAGYTVASISGNVTEEGGTTTFTVRLNSQPLGNVSIQVSSSDETEGTMSPKQLTFTSTNWKGLQKVTVTGVNDDVQDANNTFNVVLSAAQSSDPKYNGLNPDDVSVINVDDDRAGFLLGAVVGTPTEEGSSAQFTLRLTSQPMAEVTIGISSSDTGEAEVFPTSLKFTPDNWKGLQTITVTGKDDFVADRNQPVTVLLSPAVSTDSTYHHLDPENVLLHNTDNDSAGFIVSEPQGVITEKGGIALFKVRLSSQPTAEVQVMLHSSDEGEGIVAPASLTFTADNWNGLHEITVTGVNDHSIDGNQPFHIILEPATSSDWDYNEMNPPDVSVVNNDDDTANFIVSTLSGPTSEKGKTATFTVQLTSQPDSTVTVGVSSSDSTEGTVSPTSLSFSANNWNGLHTVTVTGIDDAVQDNNQSFTVILAPAVSTDSHYKALDPDNVTVINEDDDVAGINVSKISGNTKEDGRTASFTVRLNSQPTANVTVGISSSDTTEGKVSPASLIFTPDDWNGIHTVTVTGVND